MYTINNFGIIIKYLKIQPEADELIEKELLPTHHQNQAQEQKLYTSLGYYDYILIMPFYEQDQTKVEILSPAVMGNFLISGTTSLCYGWQGITQPANSSLFKEDVLAISHFKLNSALLKVLGIELEDLILHHISKKWKKFSIDSSKITIMGRLGWGELVFILSEKNVDLIAKVILYTRSLTTEDLGIELPLIEEFSDLGDNPCMPIFETSFTNLAMSLSWVRSLRGPTLPVSNKIQDVRFRTSVYCKPGCISIAKSKIDECFGKSKDFFTAFGKEDIIVDRKMPLPIFLKTLWRFRRKAAAYIISTETVPHHLLEIIPGKKGEEPAKKKHAIAKKLIEPPYFLKTFDSYVFERIMQMIADINSRITNSIDSECFDDMLLYVKDTLAKIKVSDFELPELAWRLEELKNSCNLFAYGFQQRFNGSYASMYNNNIASVVRFDGGVHRVISSVHYMVEKALSHLGQEWSGFIMFGERDKFYCHSSGVINLPFSSLLSPESWWLLFHEIGHEFTFRLKLDQNKILIELMKEDKEIDIKNIAKESIVPYEIDFFWEISADFFDLFVGFQSDWELYITAVWNSLLQNFKNRPQLLREYLLRTLLILWIAIKEDNSILNDHKKFAKDWETLSAHIKDMTGKRLPEEVRILTTELESSLWGEFTTWFRSCVFIADLIKKHINKPKLPQNEEDFSSVLIGKPFKKVLDPISLIRKLISLKIIDKKNLTFSQNIATILSLWSSYQQQPHAKPFRFVLGSKK